MNVRWWRIAIVYEEAGDPWTWTFHVRALTEAAARRLVAGRAGRPHAVYACVASDPLPRVAREEAIVAEAGPWRRSWAEPVVAPLRGLLTGPTARDPS